MFDELYSIVMQYAVVISSPQRPLPERAPVTRIIIPANQFARREEDEYKISDPQLLSNDSPIPEKERFRYNFDLTVKAINASLRNTRYDRKVPSKVPDFRAPIRLNKG
jgi:hypothetical protein